MVVLKDERPWGETDCEETLLLEGEGLDKGNMLRLFNWVGVKIGEELYLALEVTGEHKILSVFSWDDKRSSLHKEVNRCDSILWFLKLYGLRKY